jgi:hypothetical protein
MKTAFITSLILATGELDGVGVLCFDNRVVVVVVVVPVCIVPLTTPFVLLH